MENQINFQGVILKSDFVTDRAWELSFLNIFSPPLPEAFPKPQRQNGLERKYRLQAHVQQIFLLWNGVHGFNLCHFSVELGGWALRIAP